MGMNLGVTTNLFLPLRLHPGLLDSIKGAGARSIQIVAARHHFDYTDRVALRELAAWFRDNNLEARLHGPIYPAGEWSRHVDPRSTSSTAKSPAASTPWTRPSAPSNPPSRSPSAPSPFTSACATKSGACARSKTPSPPVEHLNAFARPLGVQLLLENLQNEVTTPEHLLEILRAGHFDSVGLALDIGHAHLTDFQNPGAGIDAAFELLRPRIAELHLHDNHGQRDQHLWPGDGSIDLPNLFHHIDALPSATPVLLEIAHELNPEPSDLQPKLANLRSTHQQTQEQTQEEAQTQRTNQP